MTTSVSLHSMKSIVNYYDMNEIRDIIRNIKLLVLDVDGVLTDGALYYFKEGEAFKRFNAKDGQGIKLAQAYDIEIALISGRECKIVNTRFTELGIKYIYQHCHDKAKRLKLLASELGISLEETAYVGDDILDVPPMEIVGLPICPKDAHPSVALRAKVITENKGGEGCVREVIDLILKEQGKIKI